MKPMTTEWVDKAEEDFVVVERESRARKKLAYSAIAFHAQQCAEKYLKARLCEADRDIPRTHELCALLDLVRDLEPAWELMRDALVTLTNYAVAYRYPGNVADRKTALATRKLCRSFRQIARTSLGIKPQP